MHLARPNLRSTLVALDASARPIPVPRVVAETDKEARRMAGAAERRRERLEQLQQLRAALTGSADLPAVGE